ncbi:thioesterase II family protein [Streptomyces sp. NBC_00258]|uniref:thioesterase II family protein n=1 Tax=Streptomyces sp. NBC_00258 TaxID=2903642 RepID=UPI002E2E6E48|nr:alpha/beta fold hydrolase [Streptomyces sp. NBC_00258]
MPIRPFSLVCLPFAGSGAGFYRAWGPLPVEGGRVLPVQLPGREERFLDDPFEDVQEAVAGLTPRLVEEAGADASIVLFGHSLGAVLAYEIARELERTGYRGLRHLYVSGAPGPGNGRTERATGLADNEFLDRVREFAGYRHQALDEPELLEILLPLLRADVAMHENYKPSSSEPLTVPVTALRGADDTLVSREQAHEWASVTVGGFAYLELPGGHMYLADAPGPLLHAIAEGTGRDGGPTACG